MKLIGIKPSFLENLASKLSCRSSTMHIGNQVSNIEGIWSLHMGWQLYFVCIVIEPLENLVRSNLLVLKLGIGSTRLSFLRQIDTYQITFFKEKLSFGQPAHFTWHLLLGSFVEPLDILVACVVPCPMSLNWTWLAMEG
jgi:hypothetical protein